MLQIPVVLALSLAKPDARALVEKSWNQTLVIGHRGAAAYKPENTVESFREAVKCRADGAECDVYTNKDGDLVVMHDSTLDRTTKLKGKVADAATSELKAAGVPFLADYTRVTRNRLVSVIEIKGGAEVEAKVIDHLKKEKMLGQSIIFSFSADRIALVKKLEPSLFSVWLVGLPGAPAGYDRNVFAKAAEIRADGIGVDYSNASPELAAGARQRSLPLFVWTVPPGPEVERLKGLKVNFIITNHPRDIREQLAARQG